MKDQKGITLVALIITIIVMLILVAVTISVALNGGLFTRARQASLETKIAEVKEAMALAKAEVLSEYYAKLGNTTTPYTPVDGKGFADLVNAYLDKTLKVDNFTVTATNESTTYTFAGCADSEVASYFKGQLTDFPLKTGDNEISFTVPVGTN